MQRYEFYATSANRIFPQPLLSKRKGGPPGSPFQYQLFATVYFQGVF